MGNSRLCTQTWDSAAFCSKVLILRLEVWLLIFIIRGPQFSRGKPGRKGIAKFYHASGNGPHQSLERMDQKPVERILTAYKMKFKLFNE